MVVLLYKVSLLSEAILARSKARKIDRLLFKFVLKIFYGTIVVENAHVIPPRGKPW